MWGSARIRRASGSFRLPNPLKLVLTFVAVAAGALVLVGLATLVAAGFAGPTVRGGERAVTLLGFFDLGVAALAVLLFARLSAAWSAGLVRGLWIAAFVAAQLLALAGVGLVTLVLFNR